VCTAKGRAIDEIDWHSSMASYGWYAHQVDKTVLALSWTPQRNACPIITDAGSHIAFVYYLHFYADFEFRLGLFSLINFIELLHNVSWRKEMKSFTKFHWQRL
jgi:hypothetical protein